MHVIIHAFAEVGDGRTVVVGDGRGLEVLE